MPPPPAAPCPTETEPSALTRASVPGRFGGRAITGRCPPVTFGIWRGSGFGIRKPGPRGGVGAPPPLATPCPTETEPFSLTRASVPGRFGGRAITGLAGGAGGGGTIVLCWFRAASWSCDCFRASAIGVIFGPNGARLLTSERLCTFGVGAAGPLGTNAGAKPNGLVPILNLLKQRHRSRLRGCQ